MKRWLRPDSFQGHPIGNKWYSLAPNMGPRPQDPTSNSRRYIEAKKIPQLELPAIIQPYEKVGQSQSGIIFDTSAGKFGPFAHQAFSSDQHHSNIARYVLQEVNGHFQGACRQDMDIIGSAQESCEFKHGTRLPDEGLVAVGPPGTQT